MNVDKASPFFTYADSITATYTFKNKFCVVMKNMKPIINCLLKKSSATSDKCKTFEVKKFIRLSLVKYYISARQLT